MDEYNLNRDAVDYGSSLQAYNEGLLRAQGNQAQAQKKADDAHDEWATPVEILSGEALGKPVKTFIKKAGEKFVKKGVKTAEKIVKDRVDKATQRLTDNFRARMPKGSSLGDVRAKFDPTTLENDSSLRGSFNRLRKLQGREPVPDKAPTEAPTSSEPQAPTLSEADVPVVSNPTVSASENAQASNVADTQSPQINFDDITTKDQATEATSALRQKYNNLTPAQQSEVNARFQADPAKLDIPNKGEVLNRTRDNAFRTNGKALDGHINDVVSEVPRPNVLTQAGGQQRDTELGADEDFKGTQPFQQPKTISQTGGANNPTTEDSMGDDPVSGFMGDLESKGASVAGKVADTADIGLESAGATADAVAGAEGGLNPIADLVALGLGIAGLFGASHKAPTPKVPFSAVNPSVQHGI